jgi:hypothetical protein
MITSLIKYTTPTNIAGACTRGGEGTGLLYHKYKVNSPLVKGCFSNVDMDMLRI